VAVLKDGITDLNTLRDESVQAEALNTRLRVDPAVQVEEEESGGTTLGAFGAGFATTGYLSGTAQIEVPEDSVPDPSYTHPAYFNNNPDDLKYAQPYFDDTTNPLSEGLMERMKQVRNSAQMKLTIEQHRTATKRLAEIADSPIRGFLGTLTGVGLDIAATIGATLLTGGGGAAAAGGSTVMRAIQGLNMFRSGTSGAARLAAAARVGAFGAAEGAGERAVQGISDPMVTSDDVVFGALAGALFGGALGGAFPRAVGGFAKQYKAHVGSDTESAILELTEIARMRDEARGGSVGAMEAPLDAAGRLAKKDEREIVLGKGGATWVARRIPGIAKSKLIFRNAKRRITDMYGHVGRLDLLKGTGLRGAGTFFDSMSRIYHFTPMMEGERLGEMARAPSFQTWFNSMEISRAARNDEIDREFASMSSEVFEIDQGLSGLVHRVGAEDTTALKLVPKTNKAEQAISKADYEKIADEISQAMALNRRVDAEEAAGNKYPGKRQDLVGAIPEGIVNRLSPEQIKKLTAHAKKTAQGMDDWWMSFQKDMVDQKLLAPEDVIDGYRPQVWNSEEIALNATKFKNWLIKVFEQEPDAKWVRENWGSAKDPDTGKLLEDFWQDGETWAEFSGRMPEEAREIFEDWGLTIKRYAERKAEDATNQAKIELGKLNADAVDEIEVRYARENARDAKIIDKNQTALDAGEEGYTPRPSSDGDGWGTTTWAQRKAQLVNRLGKAEVRQGIRQQRLKALNDALDDVNNLQAILNRYAPNPTRRRSAKTLKTVRRRERREAVVAGGKTLDERIEEVFENMTTGNNNGRISDMSSQNFVAGNSRLMQRQIHLGTHRFSDEARQFLRTDSSTLRRTYSDKIGSRIALRKAFDPVMRRNGVDWGDHTGDRAAIEKTSMQGFVSDIEKAQAAGDFKTVKKQQELQQHAIEDMKRALDEIDRVEIKADNALAAPVSLTLNATAIASLGSSVLTATGDMGLMVMGGSKLSTGFRGMMNQPHVRKMFREIQQDEPRIAALYMGQNVMDHTRWQHMAGVDIEMMAKEGTRMRTYQRLAEEIGHVQAMATFMNSWNKLIRMSFGHDFMLQIRRDLDGYADIPGHRKSFYARLGIDRETASEMADLMRRHGKDYGPNKELRVPDTAAWGRERPDLLARWEGAIKAAGDEVLLDPQHGDLPFLRGSPIGRLILQFTSFMFTAAERAVPKLTQGIVTHPEDAGIYVFAGAAVGMGYFVDTMKTIYHGKDLEEKMNQSASNQLWGAVVRSPLAVSMMGTILDNAFTLVGPQANDLTGTNFFPEVGSKFKRSQGAWSIFGPAAGLAAGTGYSIAGNIADGDTEKALSRAGRLFPIYNTLLIQGLIKGLDAAGDD